MPRQRVLCKELKSTLRRKYRYIPGELLRGARSNCGLPLRARRKAKARTKLGASAPRFDGSDSTGMMSAGHAAVVNNRREMKLPRLCPISEK